jgi:hypothetical protein
MLVVNKFVVCNNDVMVNFLCVNDAGHCSCPAGDRIN